VNWSETKLIKPNQHHSLGDLNGLITIVLPGLQKKSVCPGDLRSRELWPFLPLVQRAIGATGIRTPGESNASYRSASRARLPQKGSVTGAQRLRLASVSGFQETLCDLLVTVRRTHLARVQVGSSKASRVTLNKNSFTTLDSVRFCSLAMSLIRSMISGSSLYIFGTVSSRGRPEPGRLPPWPTFRFVSFT
jgi:hypothetical protein